MENRTVSTKLWAQPRAVAHLMPLPQQAEAKAANRAVVSSSWHDTICEARIIPRLSNTS